MFTRIGMSEVVDRITKREEGTFTTFCDGLTLPHHAWWRGTWTLTRLPDGDYSVKYKHCGGARDEFALPVEDLLIRYETTVIFKG